MKPGRIKPLRWGYLRNLPKFTEGDFLFDGTRMITQSAEKPSDVTGITATTVKGFLEQMFYPTPAPVYVPIQITTFEIVSENNIATDFTIVLNKVVSFSNVTGFLTYQIETGRSTPDLYANIIHFNANNFVINGTSVALKNPIGIMLSPSQVLFARFYISEDGLSESTANDQLNYNSQIGNGNGIFGIEYTKVGAEVTKIIAAYSFLADNISSITLIKTDHLGNETSYNLTADRNDFILDKDISHTIPTNQYLRFTLQIISNGQLYQETRDVLYSDTPINAITNQITFNSVINIIDNINLAYNQVPSSTQIYLLSSSLENVVIDCTGLIDGTVFIYDDQINITEDKLLVMISNNNGYSDVSYIQLEYEEPSQPIDDYSILYFYDTIDNLPLGDVMSNIYNNEYILDDYAAHASNGYIQLSTPPSDTDKFIYIAHKKTVIDKFDTIFFGMINGSEYSGMWGCPSNTLGNSNDMMYAPYTSDETFIIYRSKRKVKPTEKVFLLKDCTRLFILGANQTTSNGSPYIISNTPSLNNMDQIKNLILRNSNEDHVVYPYNLPENGNLFWAVSFYVAYITGNNNFVPDQYSENGVPGTFELAFDPLGELVQNGLTFKGYKNKYNWNYKLFSHTYTDSDYNNE